MTRLLLILLTLIAGWTHAQQPLPAEQAFRLTAQRLDAHTLEARWEIAPGYYLYRNKFRFETDPATARLGRAGVSCRTTA
jgi:thiol:disulfide interchange protein DsbD